MAHPLDGTKEHEDLSKRWWHVHERYDVKAYEHARLLEWAVLGHCPFATDSNGPIRDARMCIDNPPGKCDLSSVRADRCGPLMVLHYNIPMKCEEVMT
jgi:hypothetical protein